MADGIDAYDVAAMVVKAQNEERAARQRHIEDIARDLRAEFRRETMELREEVGELVAEVHNRLETKTGQTLDGLQSIARMVDERTGHLA
jgi:hypothetical protein